MSILFSRESIRVVMENQQLIEQHWGEVVADGAQRKLDVNWDFFLRCESVGGLVTFVAREQDEIVGYAVFLLQYHLHCKTTVSAHNDAIFIRKDKRKGGLGIRFLQYIDEELPRLGANMIFFHVKPAADFGPFLTRRLKYKFHETIYVRHTNKE